MAVPEKGKEKMSNVLRKAMIILLAGIMCVSGLLMVRRNLELKKEAMEFAKLQEEMAKEAESYAAQQMEQQKEEQAQAPDAEPAGEQETGAGPTYEAPQILLDEMEAHPDCIGYIDIEDTNVHYPVMQNADNEYYLHRDVDGKDSISGCIYMDSNHDISAKGLHVIYGHHMKNGTMFKDIARFADPSYMEVHQDIRIWAKNREICLKPVYCYAGKADGTYRQILTSHGQVVQFIMDHTGMEINTDSLYVLVTCSYGSTDERTYLYCVPEKDAESHLE